MATVKVVKRARPNPDGSHPLQLKITKNKKYLRLNLGQTVKDKDWDAIKMKVKRSHPNMNRVNNLIISKIAEANNLILELEAKDSHFTLQLLKDKLTGRSTGDSFFAQADIFIETLQTAGKVNRVSNERPHIKHFKNFLGGKEISFREITPPLLNRYKAYLIGQVKVSERSAMNYIATIRTVFNQAIMEGKAEQADYPFGRGKFKIKYPESMKIGWSEEEIIKLKELDLDEDSFFHHARNLWLFSFYNAGIRVSDVLMLKWNAILGGRLYYTMGKNHKPGSLIISEQAQEILNQYIDQRDETGLVFPDMKDVPDLVDPAIYKPLIKNRTKKINTHLKLMAEMLEIEKPITMHVARHSFAQLSASKISLHELQALYRHTSIETTRHYQKSFNTKGTDEALKSVINF